MSLDRPPTLRDIKRDLGARAARGEPQSGRSFLPAFHAAPAPCRGPKQTIIAAPIAERLYQVGHVPPHATEPLRQLAG
jgi:hypothetical protein